LKATQSIIATKNTVNSQNCKTPYNLVNKIKKSIFLFGLIFAQISNFVFWLEEAISIEEFFVFDMFLIFSLFIIILTEYGFIKSRNLFINYTCF